MSLATDKLAQVLRRVKEIRRNHNQRAFDVLSPALFDGSYLKKYKLIGTYPLRRYASFAYFFMLDEETEVLEETSAEKSSVLNPPSAPIQPTAQNTCESKESQENVTTQAVETDTAENKISPPGPESTSETELTTQMETLSMGSTDERNSPVDLDGCSLAEAGTGENMSVPQVTGDGAVVYCLQVPLEHYHTQGERETKDALKMLLQSMIENKGGARAVRNQRLRAFHREHPDIFLEVMGEEAYGNQLALWKEEDEKLTAKIGKAIGTIWKVLKR